MAIESPDRLAVDLSGVRSSSTRAALRQAIEALGRPLVTRTQFWGRFGVGESAAVLAHTLVIADLHEVVSAFARVEPHVWTAAVRIKRPFILACVRTQRDRAHVDLLDDIMRLSESRFAVCELKATTKKWTQFTECLTKAIGALEPEAILGVRYVPAQNAIWVEFSDGLSGIVTLDNVLPAGAAIRPETAVVSEDFNVVEFLDEAGDVFDVDGASIRALLDPAFRKEVIDQELARSHKALGQVLRDARVEKGLTQTQLAEISGLEQALISKLERGRHQPRFDTLQKYAGGLEMPIGTLLSSATPGG